MASSLEQILTTASTGMSAQSIRMSTISSNLANASSVGKDDDSTYRAKYPVFSQVAQTLSDISEEGQVTGGVQVSGIVSNNKPLPKHYEPNNPLADSAGYIHMTDVNPIEEMTNMISASREYQANVEAMNTAKNLLLRTLSVLKE